MRGGARRKPQIAPIEITDRPTTAPPFRGGGRSPPPETPCLSTPVLEWKALPDLGSYPGLKDLGFGVESASESHFLPQGEGFRGWDGRCFRVAKGNENVITKKTKVSVRILIFTKT